MSDFITPINQLPTPCDFGPFAGGYCGKVITIDFNQGEAGLEVANLEIELFETATADIDLSDLVGNPSNIDWTKTTFSPITGGTGTYTLNNTTLRFVPDQTPSMDRVVTFDYNVESKLGTKATGTITINIKDQSPTLTAQNVSVSGREDEVFTIDIKPKVIATNTTVMFTGISATVISVQPSEGTATASNGIITYTPSQIPSINRTITFKYKVTDITGLTAEATISVALTDITPAVTTSHFTKSVNDNATLTGSILSNATIKNDTFKSLTFGTISEGTIVANGSNYTFTPATGIQNNRTVTVQYTVTSTTGAYSTSTLTINITYINVWATTFWYGNSTAQTLTQALIETDLTKLSGKSNYVGTYSIGAGTGTYKWFVYPKSWGETPTILDASNNMPIATDDNKYLTVNGIELVAIRSYYTLNGAISIKFS